MSHVSLESAAPVSDVSIRTEWRVVLILALWFVAVAMAVGVHRDIPVIDDWTYAWSVERLLDDGRIEVLDWSAVYPLAHSLWGAAWSLVLGFSFATLRLSTLALSLLATCALYLILRELDARPRVALLGALTVAANPVVLLLSSSFMTDVPFVASTLMALLCYTRAMRRGQIHLVWWGGAWACVAFLDRQIAIVTPLAALPLLMPRPGGEPKRSAVLLALGATWGAMLVCSLAMMSLVRPTGEMMKLVDRLQYLLHDSGDHVSELQPLRPVHHCLLRAAGIARDGHCPPSVAQASAVRRDPFPRGDHAGIRRRDPGPAPAWKHVDARRSRWQSWADQRASALIGAGRRSRSCCAVRACSRSDWR